MLALLLSLLLVGLSTIESSRTEASSCVIKFGNSTYGVGIHNETLFGTAYCAYLGVRYAEPPTGALRFKSPVPYIPRGTENYTVAGSVCPQQDDITDFKEVIGDEDCLFMNIYAPQTTESAKHPVLLFIHGGSFIVGSSLENVEYGVDLLVNNGIMVVSINYRLSTLGFLRYPAWNISGNFGLKDQRAALQWVQKYIKYFGGDPQRVTLMGHSAGAGAVTHHLYAEGSRGLFQQLFALGGSMLAPWAVNYNAQKGADKLIAYFNVTSLEQLQEIDYKQLTYSENDEDLSIFGFFTMFYADTVPAIEDADDPDAFLTIEPHAAVLQEPASQVPIMLGNTATEFELLLFYANFLYVGENFPNNQDEALLRRITKLVYQKARAVLDPNFFRKLANTVNLYYPIKRFLRDLSVQLPDTVPIYYYQFEFDGRFGFYKNEFYKSRTQGSRYGAVHGDELGYIFSPYILQDALANRSEFRREWKVHERMVELVTNFVKYGNPTPKKSKLSNILWPAYNENTTEPMYLHIDEQFEIRSDADADNELVRFWEPIYECLYYYSCEAIEQVDAGPEWLPNRFEPLETNENVVEGA